MYIENVIVGKPELNAVELLSKDAKDWQEVESKITMRTESRYLPEILWQAGLVASKGEVRRNKPQYNIELERGYYEIKWGKRKLFIVV